LDCLVDGSVVCFFGLAMTIIDYTTGFAPGNP
jgi:hypothetical protein